MSYHCAMDVFDGLADPVRRALLTRLATAPARVVDLAAEQQISRPGVSKHLRVLGDVGLVRAEARGRERIYRLDPTPLTAVHDLLDQLAGAFAEPAPGSPVDLGARATSGPARHLTDQRLDALDTEVRRTTRRRRAAAADPATPAEEIA